LGRRDKTQSCYRYDARQLAGVVEDGEAERTPFRLAATGIRAIDNHAEMRKKGFETWYHDSNQHGRVLVLNPHLWLFRQRFRIGQLNEALGMIIRRQRCRWPAGSRVLPGTASIPLPWNDVRDDWLTERPLRMDNGPIYAVEGNSGCIERR